MHFCWTDILYWDYIETNKYLDALKMSKDTLPIRTKMARKHCEPFILHHFLPQPQPNS